LKIVDNKLFDFLIDALIVYYCFSYTLEKAQGDSLRKLDEICLIVFIFEFILRYLAHGFFIEKTGLLRDNFHLYDITIVTLAFIYTFIVPEYSHYNLLIFRFLRIIQLLPFKHLTLIFEGIFACILQLSQIYSFFLIFCCIFSFIGMTLFSNSLQNYCLNLESGSIINWNNICGENMACSLGQICVKTLKNLDNDVTSFNDFLHAFLQVIRIITFDNWNSLLKQILATWNVTAYLYFIPLAIFGNFLVINLFLAVLKAEFESFQKRKNIKNLHKSSVSAATKANFFRRNSSLMKRNGILNQSFLKKSFTKGSLSKISVAKMASIEDFFAEKQANDNVGRVYRRFLMKLIHFEKYSQKFVTFFERIHDILNDLWENCMIEHVIKFPKNNKMNYSIIGEFYSENDVLPNKKEENEEAFRRKLWEFRRKKKLKIDVKGYFSDVKMKFVMKNEKKVLRIPLYKRKLRFFKVIAKNLMDNSDKKQKKSDFTRISVKKRNQRSCFVKESERFCLKNYEDIKFAINENMLKAEKKKKAKENDKSNMQSYYDILVLLEFLFIFE